jgi:hypothetical protein
MQQNYFQNLDYRLPVIDESRVGGVVSPRDLFKSALGLGQK